jgi:glycosyltransferase involved in cell wall biosynthesis
MSVIRIALDANEANVAARVGSNIYAYKLLCELESQTREDKTVSFTVYTSSPVQTDFPKEREGWMYKTLTPSKLWTQWRYPLELYINRHAFDLSLSLGHYAPRFSPIPSIVCVLDLAFLHFPQFFKKKDVWQLTAWTKYSVMNAAHIITISENSRLDIIKEYRRKKEEISIVYPGVELPSLKSNESEDANILKSYGLERHKYLVSLGTVQPRKNMINLVHAFEKLKDEDVKLVFVGKSGWLTDEFEKTVSMSPAKNRIIVTGFVSDEHKYALLRQSSASVLVGFYEGFGIPAIESMGVGVVPVVANTASLPEVVGEYGIMVDPYSVEDIARGLDVALATHKTSAQKEQLIAHAKTFSWEKSGKEMMHVLKDVYANLGH